MVKEITERLRDLAEDIGQYYYEAKTASRPEIKQWADTLWEIAEMLNNAVEILEDKDNND